MAYTLNHVAEHKTEASCWVIIKGKVYDVTGFLFEHPGGAQVILKYGGRDATALYEPIHPADALDKYLPKEAHLGSLTEGAIQELSDAKKAAVKTRDELRVIKARKSIHPLSRIINVQDIENVAKVILPYKVYAYYESAADDSITKMENGRAFGRFFFHPRVMRSVSGCTTTTTVLGYKTTIPVFISPAGLARLGHPNGEANLTRGAYRTGIIQMVSTYPSLSLHQISAARGSSDQPIFFQLYKDQNDQNAAERIKEVEILGYQAIVLTVDALTPANRELDHRSQHYLEDYENQGRPFERAEEGDANNLGTVGGLMANFDVNMTWKKTILWIRSVTKLPIIVKGIQCVADAVLACEAGVEGIFLSNHGGRQLEYALPPIEVLYRIRRERPDVFDRTEVYLDGSIRRGTDVLKALCLGAKAVGIGRAFLYAQSAYGEAGVVKMVGILQHEIQFGMVSLGARTVQELIPEMVERVGWQPAGTKL